MMECNDYRYLDHRMILYDSTVKVDKVNLKGNQGEPNQSGNYFIWQEVVWFK